MKILALEFSSPRRSIAVLDGDKVLAEQCEIEGQSLPPLQMIAQALSTAGLSQSQIECVAVGLGPGSYTGIRGAIALAQGWQLAAGVKLTGISSADAIAAQARSEGLSGIINVVIDAQRGDFYLGQYEIGNNSQRVITNLKIVTLSELNNVVIAGEICLGPEITRWIPAGRVIFPTGAAIGRLVLEASHFVPGEQLEPIYLRETSFIKAPLPRILPRL